MRENITTTTRALAEEIAVHRLRAHEKHGPNSIEAIPPRDYARWLPILGEEFGEVCESLTYDKDPADLRRELVDLNTVTTAWIASLDRVEGTPMMGIAELKAFLSTDQRPMVWLVEAGWSSPFTEHLESLVEQLHPDNVVRTVGRERLQFGSGAEIRVTSVRSAPTATRGWAADLVLIADLGQPLGPVREAFKPSMAARPGARIVYLFAPADPGPRPRRTNR